jgi:hypothetical protein
MVWNLHVQRPGASQEGTETQLIKKHESTLLIIQRKTRERALRGELGMGRTVGKVDLIDSPR